MPYSLFSCRTSGSSEADITSRSIEALVTFVASHSSVAFISYKKIKSLRCLETLRFLTLQASFAFGTQFSWWALNARWSRRPLRSSQSHFSFLAVISITSRVTFHSSKPLLSLVTRQAFQKQLRFVSSGFQKINLLLPGDPGTPLGPS